MDGSAVALRACGVALLLLTLSPWAGAQIHRCVGTDGKVEYRSQACEPDSTASTLKEPPQRLHTLPGHTWASPNRNPPVVPTQAVDPSSGVRIVALNVPKRAPPKQLASGAEVVVVSGYQLRSGIAQVIVNRPGADVVVVVSSYESARWQVEPTPGTRIRAILLSSYRTDGADGSLSSVLDTPTYRVSLPAPSKLDSPEFREMLSTLHQWFGIDKVAAFRGAYDIPPTIYIGAVDSLAGLTLEGEPTEIPSVLFPFSLLQADMTMVRFRNNGPDTPAAASSPLVGSKAVMDGTGQAVFEVSDDRLFRRDLPSGRRVHLPFPAGWPSVSWGNAVAFDSDLQLVSLFSFGGEGYIYRYDVKGQRWKDHFSLNNVDVGSVSYDAGARRYVAWNLMSSALLFLSPDGKLLGQKAVGSLLKGFGEIQRNQGFETRMLPVASDGAIALVYLGDRGVSRIWTYDEARHRAQLTYKGRAPGPNQIPHPAAGAAPARGAPR